MTIQSGDTWTALRALGKEQGLKQDTVVGPTGACMAWEDKASSQGGHTQPELIPVLPLAVKSTVSHGGHAKHIGKTERRAMGTVSPA